MMCRPCPNISKKVGQRSSLVEVALCVNYMLQVSLTMQLELAASNQTLGAIEKNVRAYQIKNDVSDFL